MKREPTVPPLLFGTKARWSEREHAWQWRVNPLVASAFRSPKGSWFISGTIDRFYVTSRVHAEIERALDDFELHLVSLSKRLTQLVAKSTRAIKRRRS